MEQSARKQPLKRLPALPEDVLERPVLLAVSGGADSMFLLRYYGPWLAAHGCIPIVVHCNHQIRGDEAVEDASFVEKQAEQQGYQYIVYTYEGNANDEGSLRRWRHSVYRHAADQTSAVAVALGHQREDMAESFLLMAMRGAGIAGLAAMQATTREKDGLIFLRPLLDLSREEIRAALTAAGVPWREDSTNQQPIYLRNRLRHETLPALEEIAIGSTDNLASSSEYLAMVKAFVEPFAAAHVKNSMVGRGKATLLFRRDHFVNGRELLLLPMLISKMLEHLLGDSEHDLVSMLPNRDQLHSVYTALTDAEPGDARAWRWRGAWMTLSNHWLMISRAGSEERAWREVAPHLPILLPEFHPTLSREGDEIIIDIDRGVPSALRDEMAICAPGSLKGSLTVRSGDQKEKVDLLGGGSKELADVLREAYIPAGLRAQVLVVADEAGIVWVPGIRQAGRTLFTDQTEGTAAVVIRIR